MSQPQHQRPDYRKFIPFIKVDEVAQEVTGIVTAEVKDKSGETCDYAESKPYFLAWSQEFEKATDGKSCGNLRYMHTMRVVGKGLSIEFKDAEREIWMTFKVTDADAWKDVMEGVLTGFSQGGRYVKAPDKNGRFVASPSEVSLVDNPCLGVAHFALIRADGQVEMRKVRSVELPKQEVTTTKSETVHKAGACTCDCDKCMKCMGKAAPSLKAITDALASVKLAGALVAKGMYEVADFAALLSQLSWIQRYAEWEAANEGDESPIPAELLAQLKQLCEVFLGMAAEEVAELTERGGDADYGYATYADLKKFSRLLEKANEKCKKAGTPATTGVSTMSETNQASAGLEALTGKMDQLAESLKTLVTILTPKAEPAAAAQKAAEPVAAPTPAPVPAPAAAAPAAAAAVAEATKTDGGDLAKAHQDQFTKFLSTCEDRFTKFLEAVGSQLAPPKAKQGAFAVTKAEDGKTPAGEEAPAQEAELRFVPKGAPNNNFDVSPEFSKALADTLTRPIF